MSDQPAIKQGPPHPRWPHAPINRATVEPDREIAPTDANEFAMNIAVARFGLEMHARADREERDGAWHQLVSLAVHQLQF